MKTLFNNIKLEQTKDGSWRVAPQWLWWDPL